MYDIAAILLVGIAIGLVHRGCRQDVQNARGHVLQTQAKAQALDAETPPRPSAAAEFEPSDDPPAYRDVVS